MDWTSVKDKMPPPDRKVLVVVQSPYHRGSKTEYHPFCTIACYFPRYFEKDDGNYDGDDSDYRKDNDTYYWPEGWYEWSYTGDVENRLSDEVTHWMELPALPPQEVLDGP